MSDIHSEKWLSGLTRTAAGYKHEYYPHVDWLSHIIPKHVQMEAISRSYHGIIVCDTKDSDPKFRFIHGGGSVMPMWAHYMEMRLGKSYTTLNEYCLFTRDYNINRAFIVAPNKYKFDWESEAIKFGIEDPIHVMDSTWRKESQKFVDKNEKGILITNYESLIYPATTKIIRDWVARGDCMFVADESILLKNRSTNTYKEAYSIAGPCRVRRLLTGKPATQGPHDYYSQLRILGSLGNTNYFSFRNKFCEMGGFMGKSVKGVKDPEGLRKIIDNVAFVAKRRNWVVNFDPDYYIRKTPLLPEQRRHYDTMEAEFVVWLDSAEVTAEQVITKYEKLSQISSGYIKDEQGNEIPILPFEKVPKVADLLSMLEDEIDSKVVIIATHNYVIDRCMEVFDKYNPAVIRGDVHMRKMKRNTVDEKKKFNEDPTCRVIIAQEKAVKYGHTLVGTPEDPCTVIAYLENSYSLDDRSQSEQRNIPQDQKGPNTIIDWVGSPLENSVIKALQRKESISEAVIGHCRSQPS